MRESKVLDALTDEEFKLLEQVVEKGANYNGYAVITCLTDTDIINMSEAAVDGYKTGQRDGFIKTFVPATLIGCAVIGGGYLIYTKIKKKKKDVE